MTEEVETNPIADMIDHIHHSEFEKASAIWNDAIGQRVNDSLEQEKIAMAQSMYSPEEDVQDDEEDEDLEVTDDEFEAAAEDLEADEED